MSHTFSQRHFAVQNVGLVDPKGIWTILDIQDKIFKYYCIGHKISNKSAFKKKITVKSYFYWMYKICSAQQGKNTSKIQ